MTPHEVFNAWYDQYAGGPAAWDDLTEHLKSAGYAVVPRVATEWMLVAAREWSRVKYGTPVGNDGTNGCWAAMVAAAENGT